MTDEKEYKKGELVYIDGAWDSYRHTPDDPACGKEIPGGLVAGVLEADIFTGIHPSGFEFLRINHLLYDESTVPMHDILLSPEGEFRNVTADNRPFKINHVELKHIEYDIEESSEYKILLAGNIQVWVGSKWLFKPTWSRRIEGTHTDSLIKAEILQTLKENILGNYNKSQLRTPW